jgi:hypothetical protein
MKERIVPPVLLSPYLAFFLPRLFHGFPNARDSRVSLLCFRAATLFAKYVLTMEPSSIAIWYKNKVATAVVTGLWLINGSFLVYGESPPSLP